VIGVAAFLTMISTTLTVVDAYPRLWQRSLEMSVPSLKERGNLVYNLSLLVLFGGALLIISMFLKSLRAMVDFATILSFLTAPFFAWINYRVVTDEHMPEEARPPKWLRVLSWIGMIFLTSFSLLYAGWRIWKWMGKA
jgi:Mn2+/Fe2+ NRAMP family transporter